MRCEEVDEGTNQTILTSIVTFIFDALDLSLPDSLAPSTNNQPFLLSTKSPYSPYKNTIRSPLLCESTYSVQANCYHGEDEMETTA